jgi:hypothetical protein
MGIGADILLRIRLPEDVLQNKDAWTVVVNHAYLELWLKLALLRWLQTYCGRRYHAIDGELSTKIDHMPAKELTDWAFYLGIVDGPSRKMIRRLARLRNKAAHDIVEDLLLGEDEAEESGRIVGAVLKKLRRGLTRPARGNRKRPRTPGVPGIS